VRCGAFVVMTGLCVSCSADFTPTPTPNPCPCRRLPWLAVACALKVWVVFVFGACCLQDLDRDAHFGRRIRSAGLAGQVTSTARELRAQTREASVRKGILLYCRSAFWRRTSAVPCEIAKDWHVSRSPIRPYVCVCVCVVVVCITVWCWSGCTGRLVRCGAGAASARSAAAPRSPARGARCLCGLRGAAQRRPRRRWRPREPPGM